MKKESWFLIKSVILKEAPEGFLYRAIDYQEFALKRGGKVENIKILVRNETQSFAWLELYINDVYIQGKTASNPDEAVKQLNYLLRNEPKK